ncbi:MAG: tRNA (adenosine(37)-N6)-threonylcarbamoyltransferase complex ATPase subunit type 1 TsaE [Ginsengibacter sp.]
MELIFTLQEIDKAAEKFISFLNNSRIAAFKGEMGTGKTTFIHAVCKQMGVTDKMSSPTYAIINQYKTINATTINHIDLYRLKDTEEAIQAGVEDAINSGDVCFIEWPEKIIVVLPLPIINVFIEITDDTKRRLIAKFT